MSQRSTRLVIALWLLLVLPHAGYSAPVEISSARRTAAAFLERSGAPGVGITRWSAVPEDRQPLAYIFALEPPGYVVVSADDELPPVIAYSLESEYPETAEADNPLFQLLTADLRNRLAALPTLAPAEAMTRRQVWSELTDGTPRRGDRWQQWPPAGSTPTGGWLLGNWTQSPPYNALCPLDLAHGGARSQAGCPAVAMAMILDYHQTIQETSFGSGDRYWHSYAGNAYYIPDAAMQYGFPSFGTLNGYLQTLTLHWEQGTPLTNTDKAALVFACGVGARQVYSAAGSGTFGVDQAYAAYQRFAFADCRLVLDTDPELYPDLAAEMQNAHPAHLAVVDPGWTMGHNVVVDGYNTDSYFHLNFGWGGSYNGWYLLPQGMPYGLTVVEGVILDIAPATTSVPQMRPATTSFALAGYPNPCNPRVTLSFTTPAAGHALLGVYDVAGRLQAVVLDGEISAGRQSLVWTPGRLAAGAYLTRLEIGGRVETRRLVVTRR
jgi:hypothetical protein